MLLAGLLLAPGLPAMPCDDPPEVVETLLLRSQRATLETARRNLARARASWLEGDAEAPALERLAAACHQLGWTFLRQGRYRRAGELFGEATRRARELAEGSPLELACLEQEARFHRNAGGTQALLPVLQRLRVLHAHHHPEARQARLHLALEVATRLRVLGRTEAALASLQEGLALAEALEGPRGPRSKALHHLAAQLHEDAGRLDQAAATYRHLLEQERAARLDFVGATGIVDPGLRRDLARVLRLQGRARQADAVLNEGEPPAPPDSPGPP